jgi:hypothetical protein
MRRKTTITRRTRKRASKSTRRVTSKWEKYILGMDGTQLKRAQVMRMTTGNRGYPKDILYTRLFNNMFDDDDISHICLMAKGEKVQSKVKSSAPPNDISSSDLSDNSRDDESSDEEIDNITKNLDYKTKLFISKLMKDLESVQTELEAKDDDLLELEKMYVANKEALVLERSEVASLHKALAKEQEDHALTKKANVTLNKKYCVLDEKYKEL